MSTTPPGLPSRGPRTGGTRAGPVDKAGRLSPLHGVSSHRHSWPIPDSQSQGKVALGEYSTWSQAGLRRGLSQGLCSDWGHGRRTAACGGSPCCISRPRLLWGPSSQAWGCWSGRMLSSNKSWTLSISKERMIRLFLCPELPWLYLSLTSPAFRCDAFGPQRGWGKWYLRRQVSESMYLSPPLGGGPAKSSGQTPVSWAWKHGHRARQTLFQSRLFLAEWL